MKSAKKNKKEKYLNEVESTIESTSVGSSENQGGENDSGQKDTGPTQREAVYEEIMRVMQDNQIPYDPTQPVKPLLNEEMTKTICSELVSRFLSGAITLKPTESNQKKLSDVKLMELYVVGLVNNWLKRDRRLNGKGEAKALSA